MDMKPSIWRGTSGTDRFIPHNGGELYQGRCETWRHERQTTQIIPLHNVNHSVSQISSIALPLQKIPPL
eukprot:4283690-Amphidinium_carterae.1